MLVLGVIKWPLMLLPVAGFTAYKRGLPRVFFESSEDDLELTLFGLRVLCVELVFAEDVDVDDVFIRFEVLFVFVFVKFEFEVGLEVGAEAAARLFKGFKFVSCCCCWFWLSCWWLLFVVALGFGVMGLDGDEVVFLLSRAGCLLFSVG